MIALAPRILNLPADVRAALARVDGPGWILYADNVSKRDPNPRIAVSVGESKRLKDIYYPRKVFFPANPAASVAAVTGWSRAMAYSVLTERMLGYVEDNDDHAAALSIIEAYAANRGPHV